MAENHQLMTVCLIGLGSNVGDRARNLRGALAYLGAHRDTRVLAVSRFYETLPSGGPADQPRFLNAAIVLETVLEPAALWALLTTIEDQAGRRRDQRWGPRTLDLDLLLYGDQTIDTAELVVPHPRMAVRRFVLEPAAEIASDLLHPPTGWTVGRLYRHLCEAANYVAIAGLPGTGKTRLAQEACRHSGAAFLADVAAVEAHDSSGPTWGSELELSLRRAMLLEADDFAEIPRWRISDFWLPQSLAYARVWLAAPEYERFVESWEPIGRRVVAPKFTVWLEGQGVPIGENQVWPQPLGCELLALLKKPGQGPVLWLRASDQPAPLEHVLAALESMQ